MSELITFPLPAGTNYVIPDVGDENWGQNVTDFLVAIPLGVMPTSGTFSLTGDVSFGPTFGLVSQYFKTATTVPATAGFIRLSKTDAIEWRNNLGSGNLSLAIDGSDQLIFNGDQLITSGSSPTFAALTLSAPLTVPNGGTGDSTFTAYTVLCAGTTPTGTLQNVVDVGLNGQFLQSNGPGLLPTWANAVGSGTVNSGTLGRFAVYAASTDAISDTLLNNGFNVRFTGPSTVMAQATTFVLNDPGISTAKIWTATNAAPTANSIVTTNNVGNMVTTNVVNSSISMNSNKITSLGNGTAVDDAAAIGQVQYAFQAAIYNTDFTTANISSATYTATNLQATIIPSSVSNRIKVTININSVAFTASPGTAHITIFRNGVDVESSGNGLASFNGSLNQHLPIAFTILDSPATVAGVTYSVRIKTNAGTLTYNQFTAKCEIILEELR